jgi:hypothetical protein
MNATMRTVTVIFVLALISIAAEIYSDNVLAGANLSRPAVPDPATVAIANGLKHR